MGNDRNQGMVVQTILVFTRLPGSKDPWRELFRNVVMSCCHGCHVLLPGSHVLHNMLLVPCSHKEIEIKLMASGSPLENLRPIPVVLVVR